MTPAPIVVSLDIRLGNRLGDRRGVAYHLDNSQLRVFRKFVRQERNVRFLRQTRLIVLEHILPTTEDMIHQLRDVGTEIFALIGKPYSVDASTLSRIEASGIPVRVTPYRTLEEPGFLDDVLAEALAACDSDGKTLAIIEVGGYFARPLSALGAEPARHLAGVVEDTTFGHNRYLKSVSTIPVPVFSVARSRLKELEARYVGRDAVAAVEQLLRERGVSISGRHALVVGYGMIGENVAHCLRTYDMHVSVFDKHAHRNLRAFIDGFGINSKINLLSTADIIFSATGDERGALSYEEIEKAKDGVILCSVGSKDTEFDIASVIANALSHRVIVSGIVQYEIPGSMAVNVVNNGTAVNFLRQSIPTEVIDLVFSEILLCIMLLLKKEEYKPGNIHIIPDKLLNEIAQDWLRYVTS